MSEFSEYTSILPKHLFSATGHKKSSRGTAAAAGGPTHKHRLQTTYTINEAGEREYTMSALSPDPVAELDDKHGYVKPTQNENEKIVYL
jgi:hypothetical protein